jgi:hypothetical protein
MATYDHKQVLLDYANGKITPEMAIGHSLQHIDKLYEAQAKIDTLEKRVNTQQVALDRLTTFMDKVLRAQKKKST